MRHHHTNGTEASAGQEKIHHISTDHHHRIICINKMRQYLMGRWINSHKMKRNKKEVTVAL